MSLALLGTLLVFVVLAVGADESWAATLAVIIAVAATAAVHWPTPSYRAFQVGLLIFLSGIGGLLVLLTELEANEKPALAPQAGVNGPMPGITADRQLGRFLAGRTNVLIDASAHPEVVAARGSAERLVTASDVALPDP